MPNAVTCRRACRNLPVARTGGLDLLYQRSEYQSSRLGSGNAVKDAAEGEIKWDP